MLLAATSSLIGDIGIVQVVCTSSAATTHLIGVQYTILTW